MKHSYYLALGSNLGDRAAYLQQARLGLEQYGEIVNQSDVVITEPFGVADQPFLNQVLHYTSALTPVELLDQIKPLETKLGRQPREHWGNREIDIDIILWNGGKLDTVTPDGYELHLPHPELNNRPFILKHLSPNPFPNAGKGEKILPS